MHNKNSIFNGSAFWCGIACATSGFVCATIFGTPFEMIHMLGGMNILPPIWIFNLLYTAWFFLIGIAAGSVINSTVRRYNAGSSEIAAYKGGIFFLVCFFLSLIRYYLFFFSGKLFISLLLSVISMMCSLICAFTWHKVQPKISSVAMFAFSIWQFYIFFVNLSVFLHN